MEELSSEALRELDARFHLHPFTNHDEMHAQGTHLVRSSDGVYVEDETGRKLIDGLAGLWCTNVGYNRREIIDAVTEQMSKVAFYPSFFNTTTEPPVRLAAKLASLAPARLNHTIFSNSGSEANETALKIIRGYNKHRGKSEKTKILSRTFSYHGVTLGATSMTGLPGCYLPFDLPLPGFIHVPGPHHYAADTKLDPAAYGQWCVKETARIIEKEGAGTIAALFAEPVQGAGGVIVPPEGYLKALRELCRKNDILFVADEVITGFGRLGDWFASNLWDLDPDLMTLAKGITSGYLPLGATMVCDEIAEVIEHGGYFAHGFTYSGQPTTAAAALANIDVLEKEKLIPYVRDDAGPYFQEKLQSFANHRAVGEVRGYGLIGAIELIPREGKAALTATSMLGNKAVSLIRAEGVIVRGIRDLIALSPPLIITRAEIDQLFDAVRKGLDRLWD
ncbi:MAG: aminotransferase [Spartobacteria bacterium]